MLRSSFGTQVGTSNSSLTGRHSPMTQTVWYSYSIRVSQKMKTRLLVLPPILSVDYQPFYFLEASCNQRPWLLGHATHQSIVNDKLSQHRFWHCHEYRRKTFVSLMMGCWRFSDPRIWGAVAASQQTFLLSPAPIQANTRGGDQKM